VSHRPDPLEHSVSIPLGVVVERREPDGGWQGKRAWQPVAVLPAAPPSAPWRELAHGDGWIRWLADTLPLELHRKETEAYRANLETDPPKVWVVLRTLEPGEATPERDVRVFLITASPHEARAFLESGEDIVEPVLMPEGVIAWVEAFVARHHVDEPFQKRKRKRFEAEDAGLGRRPERFGGPGGRNGGRGGRHGRP
jgi:hypothetical protein